MSQKNSNLKFLNQCFVDIVIVQMNRQNPILQLFQMFVLMCLTNSNLTHMFETNEKPCDLEETEEELWENH